MKCFVPDLIQVGVANATEHNVDLSIISSEFSVSNSMEPDLLYGTNVQIDLSEKVAQLGKLVSRSDNVIIPECAKLVFGQYEEKR